MTNRMRLSVVCTLIDNATRQHSNQKVVDVELACSAGVLLGELALQTCARHQGCNAA